jgi:ArsR family transcriptional regulator
MKLALEIDVLSQQHAKKLAELFKAFSDPSRLRILSVLVAAERNVGEIAGLVGISESAVSHHLRGLRQMNLVRPRREGRLVYYSLEDEHVAELYHVGLDHSLHGS